jgi:phytoene dehydrogenase-like protein
MEASLGKRDAAAWRRLFTPFVEEWVELAQGILGPLRPGFQLAHPLLSLQMARFGFSALQPACLLAERTFAGERPRALFAGMSAHALLPLERPLTAAIGLVLGTLGHVIGWSFPKGGSQTLVDALAAHLRALGGEIVTGVEVKSVRELPASHAVLFDVTPRQLLRIAGDALPAGYRVRLERYRYGPGVFKIDYALDGPIPWGILAARARRQYTWAGGWRRSRRVSAALRVAWYQSGPLRCWRSRVALILRARQRGSTPSERTATFPAAAM